MYAGIDALHDEILVPEAGRIEILRSQTALLIPLASTSEASDQVCDAVPILAHGESRKLDPWACAACLRGFRIERLVDVRGNLFRVRADTLLRQILRHRLRDEPHKLGNRPLTCERAGVV